MRSRACAFSNVTSCWPSGGRCRRGAGPPRRRSGWCGPRRRARPSGRRPRCGCGRGARARHRDAQDHVGGAVRAAWPPRPRPAAPASSRARPTRRSPVASSGRPAPVGPGPSTGWRGSRAPARARWQDRRARTGRGRTPGAAIGSAALGADHRRDDERRWRLGAVDHVMLRARSLASLLEVDVGRRASDPLEHEAVGLAEHRAVLDHQAVAAEHEVLRRLGGPAAGVDVGARAAGPPAGARGRAGSRPWPPVRSTRSG